MELDLSLFTCLHKYQLPPNSFTVYLFTQIPAPTELFHCLLVYTNTSSHRIVSLFTCLLKYQLPPNCFTVYLFTQIPAPTELFHCLLVYSNTSSHRIVSLFTCLLKYQLPPNCFTVYLFTQIPAPTELFHCLLVTQIPAPTELFLSTTVITFRIVTQLIHRPCPAFYCLQYYTSLMPSPCTLRTVKAALTIQIIHPSTFYIVNLTVNIS